jgi:hypothetical protein
MIKHIVFFKLKETTAKEQAMGLAKNLSDLKEKIPQVRFMEVAFDVGRKPNSYDIALFSHFDNIEDLEAYSVHPDHIVVVNQVKQLCEASCKVDYEMEE